MSESVNEGRREGDSDRNGGRRITEDSSSSSANG